MEKQQPPSVITRAGLEDLDLLVPLFDAYRQFYQQPSDLEGARTFLAQHLIDDSSTIFLAYQFDATRVRRACGFTQLYPSFSSTSMKRLWILNDLFVIPEARHLGVASALLERARSYAVETRSKGLTLATAVDNIRAQSVYKKSGWQRDEEFYTYHLYF